MKISAILLSCLFVFIFPTVIHAQPSVFANQVAYDINQPKTAIVRAGELFPGGISFTILNAVSGEIVFSGNSGVAQRVMDWDSANYFYTINFSAFNKPGKYSVAITVSSKRYQSAPFEIAQNA